MTTRRVHTGYATFGLPDAYGRYATFGLPYATEPADDEEREVCSRCGADLLDNPSTKAGDDLCRDCRFEEDNP